MRHHDIASVRGLYYQEDQALAVWEVDGYGVVIVLPTDNPTQKQILLAVAKLLAAEGHQVRVLPDEEVTRSFSYVQSKLDL